VAASSDDRGNERSGGGGEGEQEEKTDAWMTSYADMVTLLMTFFVLMFALSNVDNERVEMFVFAMSRGGLTVEQFMEIRERYEPDPFGDWDYEYFDLPFDGHAPDEGEDEDGDLGGDQALQDLHDAIGGYIEEMGLGDTIDLVFNGEFIMLTLRSDILFGLGLTYVTPAMEEIASALGELLAATFLTADPFEITVAGHTDNLPIATARFPNNWHVSVDRAANFLDVLIRESGLEPFWFRIFGGGEFYPLADNDTYEGRQRNRRVEVMISLARGNPMWDRGPAQYD